MKSPHSKSLFSVGDDVRSRKLNRLRREPRGAAIVVVLLFIVLLSMVALAFFMKATAFRGLSQSAVNEFKADTLARSGLAIAVADLRQEIVNGSTAVTAGGTTLRIPKAAADVVPRRSGNPALNADGTDPIPNLIRRSVRSDAIVSPGVPSRASAASSLDPSRNDRVISAARWNKHYLIPRDPAKYSGSNSSVLGTDPVSAFVAPDWVYVTNKGPEVLTTSQTSVIGRYAYAIYDEGGLLDLNVAGFPSFTPVKAADPTSTAGKVWGSGNKGGASTADLTVLGLTQAQIDQIVGWRNFATSQPTGTFPNLTYDTSSAKRYFDAIHPHPKAFVQVSDTTVTSGGQAKTDQAFTSRQQLLKFRSQVGFPQDALQYLGTFSRDLDQPAFVPNPNRPKVRSAGTNNSNTYGTGNDAFGIDRDASPATDINPAFPRVAVKSSFVRRDGSTAQVGEPLVKKRFPLSRIGQILRTATASKDPSDPIYRDFGLYRSTTTEPWKYDHGNDTGILRLDQVADEGREPDFFELLKAAINVGSLGKSAMMYDAADPTVNLNANWLQHTSRDIVANLQVLQIGANIIDQFDSDGFPTRVIFAGDTVKEVRGVESLPYGHRIRLRYVQMPQVPASGPTPATNPAALLVIPEVWNPHATAAPADAPTRFRVRAENTFGASMPTSCKLTYGVGASSQSIVKSIDWTTAGILEFTAASGDFAEPVVLSKGGLNGLSGPTRTDGFNSPSSDLVGFVAADFSRQHPSFPTLNIEAAYLGQPDYGPVTFVFEYWDGSSFRPYDEITVSWKDASFPPKENGGFLLGWGGVPNKVARRDFARTDPRTSRWGLAVWGLLGLVEPIDAANNVYPSGWPSLDKPPFGPKDYTPTDRGFVNTFSNYTNNDWPPNHESRHRGFTQGYWSQNIVKDQPGFWTMGAKPFYNRDADGIARRAMGGYSSDVASGGSATNTQGLPMITGNAASRPIILNRPFRSVGELGYTFRDVPWKNLDFSFPESGDAALLDVFCVDEVNSENALVAGKVNLNTRQAPVLQALLTGATTDDRTVSPTTLPSATAAAIASELVKRTTSTTAGKGPLFNRADLVGRWTGTGSAAYTGNVADPDVNYSGFSSDLGTVAGVTGTPVGLIPAQRESSVRALADAGTTRTWNLMIDLVAQSGRFPSAGAGLNTFQVEGEKRYWLHVAIDRLTGEVLDSQFEVVTE